MFAYNAKIKENSYEAIRECYLELLYREPNYKEFNHFLALFEKGQMDEKKLIDNIKSSKEYLDRNSYSEIITRCYLELLNRQPEKVGFNYFLTLFEKGQMDEKKLIDNIKSSKEYLDRNSYSEIITRCYLELLNRQPEKVSFNHFLALFEKGRVDEKKLIDNIKSSKEYLIKICHLEVFKREVQEKDFHYYMNVIERDKIDKNDLIDIMKKTESYKRFEFRKRFSQRYCDEKEHKFLKIVNDKL